MLILVPQIQASKSADPPASATLRRWLCQVGQPVRAGESLVELETEDAFIQLQAPTDGTLAQILVEPGTTVPIGATLGTFTPGSSSGPGQFAGYPASAPEATAGPAPAHAGTAILMPQAGNTMEEGTLLKWRIKVGDTIVVGQVICEVETDKATVEVEATDAGRVSWLAAEGAVIPVKQPIALLGDGPQAQFPVAPGTAVSTPPPLPAVPVTPATLTRSIPAAPPAGVVALLMPQAGNTMEEGTILKWRVKEGDTIRVGQILCEIETDKATMEFEATDSGRLAHIVAAEGAVVPVKQPIAYLGEDAAAVAAYIAAGAVETGSGESTAGASTEIRTPAASAAEATPQDAATRVKASPAARKLAAQRAIDLTRLPRGSGPQGRILSTDLVASQVRGATPAAGTVPGIRRPMSKMRRAIALNLQTSKQTVPHFYLRLTIDADPLFAFYRAQKPDTGCTLNDVILLAVGRCVGEFAAFRSRVEGTDIVEMPSANIGVAVSVPDGLVVPVVLDVHRMTLEALARETHRVVEAARGGKIENFGRGVFTITNMGMLGVEDFSAIINPPESGILAISALRESVLVKDQVMRPGRVMSMTLSVDHRVVDGALAAQFMARLRTLLEAPHLLMAKE